MVNKVANLYNKNQVKNKISQINVLEISKIQEKRKWILRFRDSYSGDKAPIDPEMFSTKCRFFVLVIDGKEVGFIRIVNYTNAFSEFSNLAVWNASDAYVKKPYRNMGVLRVLLKHVIDNCNVRCARMETDRLTKNLMYYETLGFVYGWTVAEDGYMSIIVTDDLEDAARRRNDHISNKCI